MIYNCGNCDLFAHTVRFEVQVSEPFGLTKVYSLVAITPYGERVITTDRDKICFVCDLSYSMLSSLNKGDVIKI